MKILESLFIGGVFGLLIGGSLASVHVHLNDVPRMEGVAGTVVITFALFGGFVGAILGVVVAVIRLFVNRK
jgi:hypothetical protein